MFHDVETMWLFEMDSISAKYGIAKESKPHQVLMLIGDKLDSYELSFVHGMAEDMNQLTNRKG